MLHGFCNTVLVFSCLLLHARSPCRASLAIPKKWKPRPGASRTILELIEEQVLRCVPAYHSLESFVSLV